MLNAQMYTLGNRYLLDLLPAWAHYGSNYLQITGLENKYVIFFSSPYSDNSSWCNCNIRLRRGWRQNPLSF